MSDEKNKKVELKEKLSLREDFAPVSYDEWKAQVEEDLKGASFEKKLVTNTLENISIQPVYNKEDIKDLPFINGKPGFGEYVRSAKASGYIPGGWDIAQEITYGDAEEFNEALKNDLRKGQNSVSMVFDKPTLLGLDADYGKAGETGKDGLSISAMRSISRALDGIELNINPLYVNGGFSALPLLSLFSAYCEKQGINFSELKGSFESDPYAWLAKEGNLPMSEDSVFDEVKTSVEWLTQNAPDMKSVGVSGEVYHNAGASAVQELAFVLATAVDYITRLSEKGLDAETIVSKMRFTFGVGPFFFMEIAKFRAARYLWTIILGSYGVKEESRKMLIHGKTSGYNQTLYDPYVNMLRTTTEAFSAVIGGVDSLYTNPFDAASGLPTQFSRRIARNTQIILNEEAHLNQLIDPAGGSYFVEKLTSDIAEEAWKIFLEIEEKGGMFEALKSGFVQDEITKVVDMRDKEIAKRKAVIVGTNMYANMKEEKLASRTPDYQALYNKRAEYLQKFRTSGSDQKNRSILEKLQTLADSGSEDIVKTARQALLEGATIGEISKALRASKSGETKVAPVKVHRQSEKFEQIRDASLAFKEKTGEFPKVFLVNMGPLKQYKGRADFSVGYFEAGGFEVIYPKGFGDAEAAVSSMTDSKARVAVICSTDETYPELVPPIVKGIKDKDPSIQVVLAGYPKDQVEDHKKAGVDEFIYLGSDVYAILAGLLKKTGVL